MKIKYFYLLAVIIIFIGLFNSLRFVISTGNQPWFDDRFCIDGNSYKKGMLSIVANNDFLNLKDIYHSPGYQIYLALLYKIFPDDAKIFKIIKIISWVMTLASTALIFYFGEIYFGKLIGAIAAILFSLPYKYHVFINLLQYEVILGFLLLAYLYLHLRSMSCQLRYARFILVLLSGILASIISLIQAKFLYIVPLGFFYIYVRDSLYVKSKNLDFKNTLFALFLFTLPFLLLFATWSVYHSLVKHEIVIGTTHSLWRFKIGNNPNAMGYAFPYPELTEPSGIRFIISYPFKFLWLIKERFLYLWDFKKDIWYIENPLVSYLNVLLRKSVADLPFYFICFFVFFIGLLKKAIRDFKYNLIKVTSCFYFIVLPVLIGHLFVISSSRFLIPVLPFIFLFQAYFIVNFILKPCF